MPNPVSLIGEMRIAMLLSPDAACDAGRCRSRGPRHDAGSTCSCGRSAWL